LLTQWPSDRRHRRAASSRSVWKSRRSNWK
jgi:hypothetical protein